MTSQGQNFLHTKESILKIYRSKAISDIHGNTSHTTFNLDKMTSLSAENSYGSAGTSKVNISRNLPTAATTAAQFEASHDEVYQQIELQSNFINPLGVGDVIKQNARSPLSLLMLIVILFSGMTGLLMGYDLCIIAVILQPIADDFEVCPSSVASTFPPPDTTFTDQQLPVGHDERQLVFLSPIESRRRTLLESPCPFAPKRRLEIAEGGEAYRSCGAKQLFVSIVSPGAALGSLVAGFIADAAGRKFTLALSDGLIMAGTLMMALSQAFSLIVAGRFIVGLGIGTGFVIFSTYVSEISPDDRRGQLVSCQEVAQCVGCLAAYGIAAIGNSVNGWRAMLIAAGVVAALQVCGILLLPESPRWLIRKKKQNNAEQALRRLAGLPARRSETFVRDSASEQSNRKYQKLVQREEAAARTMQKMLSEVESEKERYRLREDATADKKTTSEKPWPSLEEPPTQVEKKQSTQLIDEAKDKSPLSPTVRPFGELPMFSKASTNYEPDAAAPASSPSGSILRVSPNIVFQQEDSTTSTTWSQKFAAQCKATYTLCVTYWWPICIAVGCAACQNFTASTAILYYSAEIFSLAGVENPFLAGTGIGLAKVIGIVLVILFVERVGRKRFLLLGSFGTLACHLTFMVSFIMQIYFPGTAGARASPIVSVIAMILYMFFQNISWAGLMFVVASEVLPSSVRGIGMGFTITCFWVLAFLTQSTLETLMEAITIPGNLSNTAFTCYTGVFLFYALTNVLAILFTWFFIPELSGKSLEEITETFR